MRFFVLSLARSADGVHKRLRGSPLPWRWYLTGQIAATTLVSAAATVLLFVVGLGLVGAEVDAGRVPAIVATFVLGAACMAVLGFAVFTWSLPVGRSTRSRSGPCYR